jgi:aryl-alcohol dehydrogenase-like predicted oxidoreductase
MDFTRLGKTGLQVSRLCLGCLSFGDPENGVPWTLNEENSRDIIRQALEAGINFFDTANSYSAGLSEEITGRALKDFARREDVVISTKVFNRVRPGPNGAGLSRRAIMHEIDASLRRLGTDFVDLYQIHRWDYETPIEETLEALNDVVRAGKARYIGASSMYAWQFALALGVSRQHGWAQFVSMQNHLNLIYREEEREMLPLCASEGLGVIPWGPLARGKLTRDWTDNMSARANSDPMVKRLYDTTGASDRDVVDCVARLASKHAVPRAQIALAWVLAKREVTAPIVGVTQPKHLQDALAALKIRLTETEIAELESPYVPHAVSGHV